MSHGRRAIFYAAVAAALLHAPVSGQNLTPQPTESPSGGYELKLPVPLVVEDVVVLDSKENPVRGLKAGDFIVAENGKRVELSSFEEHGPSPAAETANPQQPRALPILPANIFTNLPAVPQSTSLNVLLLDALNTPIEGQLFVRHQMLDFLKSLDPGARVAVFGLGTELRLLQGFTDDPAVLRDAIESRGSAEQSSALLKRRASEDPANPEYDQVFNLMMGNPNVGSQQYMALQNLEAAQDRAALRQRAILTLEAMNELARYLSVLPGHKNLIWFSGSFPLDTLPNDELSAPPSIPTTGTAPSFSAGADPYSLGVDFRDDVRRTSDLMARGRIAVYPVDARGLQPDSSYNSAQYAVNRWQDVHSGPANSVIADMHSRQLPTDPTYAEHDEMDTIAAATGGRAFYNTNGLKDAVQKILGYGESYYTLSYTPTDQKWNGAYRKILIKAGDPNLQTIYRTGYYADDPAAPPSGKSALPLNAMQTAMLHGVPNAIQIRFDAALVPGEKPVDQLTPGGHPDMRLMKAPYMRYTVAFIVDITSVQFTVDENKVHHGQLELASTIYDADGNPANSIMTRVDVGLPDDKFAQVTQQGMMTRQTIEAPANGDYFIRVGIRDTRNDHVGALEVPLKSLKSLEELRKATGGQESAPQK
ncbi:MAG TPA: VWA domain-containing protein [Terracidiphilus sp.]|nr:VWA domain-containing protein [Terracidiphilus sp.]